MANKIRECVVDGKQYEYCPHCNDKKEHWRMIFCSERCRDIDKIVRDYKANKISKSEAQEELSKLNVQSNEEFSEYIQDAVKELLSEEKKNTKKQSKKIVNEEIKPITINVPEETIVEDVTSNIVEEQKENVVTDTSKEEVLVDNVVSNLFKF